MNSGISIFLMIVGGCLFSVGFGLKAADIKKAESDAYNDHYQKRVKSYEWLEAAKLKAEMSASSIFFKDEMERLREESKDRKESQ